MPKVKIITTHAIDIARLFEFHDQASLMPYWHSVFHAKHEFVSGVKTNTLVIFEAPADLVKAVVAIVVEELPGFAHYLLLDGTVLPAQRPITDLRPAAQVSRRNSTSTHVPGAQNQGLDGLEGFDGLSISIVNGDKEEFDMAA